VTVTDGGSGQVNVTVTGSTVIMDDGSVTGLRYPSDPKC
jgi:hypothetical protein